MENNNYGLFDDVRIKSIIKMCNYALSVQKQNRGLVGLYNELRSRETLKYNLKFPVLSLEFKDMAGYIQKHAIFLEEIPVMDIDENKNLITSKKIEFHRTCYDHAPRMGNYDDLSSLENYIDRRSDYLDEQTFSKLSDTNKFIEFLQFFSLFVRTVKILDNLGNKVIVKQSRPLISLSYYEGSDDKNNYSGFSMLFYRQHVSLGRCYIKSKRYENLEKELKYSDASDAEIDLLFGNLKFILNNLRIKFDDKEYNK